MGGRRRRSGGGGRHTDGEKREGYAAPVSYQEGDLLLEFARNGSPYAGLLAVTSQDSEPYTAEVNLGSVRSRNAYAKDAAEVTGVDAAALRKGLNKLCNRRKKEAAVKTGEDASEDQPREQDGHPRPAEEEIEALVDRPGVLDRYVEDAARVQGVVGERDHLKLITLVALSAQLAPLPNSKPASVSLMLTSAPGRGKNYLCNAAVGMLPEDFYLDFESASAKTLYYKAQEDPGCLRHRFLYSNEAEGTDQQKEVYRPLLSEGEVRHMTVNRDDSGGNTFQELVIEGPVSAVIPTVRNKIDAQLQTRLLVSDLPDYEGRSKDHTRAVSKLLTPDFANSLSTGGEKSTRAWQAALKKLTEVRKVVSPLGAWEGFCLDADEIEYAARLWANLLGMMLTHAWLEQRNRQIVELEGGEKAVVATPEDYEAAYKIFESTCRRSITNLSDTHRSILDAVYDLTDEYESADGFSQRQIAERAGCSPSTVSAHKAFLTRSAQLLREVEGAGLALSYGADPSWWREDNLLSGFPRPEAVWEWWSGKGIEPLTSESAEHSAKDVHNPHSYAEKGVRRFAEHPPNGAERPTDDCEVLDGDLRERSASVRQTAERQSALGKPETRDGDALFGTFGRFEDPGAEEQGLGEPKEESEGEVSAEETTEEDTLSERDLIGRVRKELEDSPRVAALLEGWTTGRTEAGPIASSLAFNLYGTATRHEEVRPFVEEYLKEERVTP